MVPAFTIGTLIYLCLRAADAAHEAAVILDARVRLAAWHLAH